MSMCPTNKVLDLRELLCNIPPEPRVVFLLHYLCWQNSHYKPDSAAPYSLNRYVFTSFDKHSSKLIPMVNMIPMLSAPLIWMTLLVLSNTPLN